MLNTSDNQILNEIGELFGRYREADGSLSFFQNKLMQNVHFGQATNQTYDKWLESYQSSHPLSEKPAKDPFLKGVLNSSFYQERFYDWQKRVIARLQNTQNDIYVVAPPGGGKTTPLMAHYIVDLLMSGSNGDMGSLNAGKLLDMATNDNVVQKWANIFHGLLTGKYLDGKPVPRCLFVTPIRVLSFEQAEGFQEYFIDILLFLKSLMLTSAEKTPKNSNETFLQYMVRLKNSKHPDASNINKVVGMVFSSAGEDRYNRMMPDNDNDGRRFNSTIKSFTEKLICVKTGGGSGQFNDQPDNALVSIATYGSAKAFISKISNMVKFIVFDEAHLYMPSEYGPASDRSQENEVRAAADAYTIIDGMAKQKDAQIAFLSGTIHPESAQNFCDFLNRRYGRRLEVVSTEKGDTQSGNKTELHVIADDAIRDEKEQVNRIVKWVQNNEKGKAIILFSKRKIDKLVAESIKRLSQKDIRQDFNVNQSDRYRKEKIDRFRRALAYSNPNASAAEIQKSVDDFIKKEFPTTQQEKIDRIKSKPGAMMIKNKTLRNAVSYGIGYIYRQDEIEPNDPTPISGESKEPIAEQDKLIVANLFSQGKINVLLATAAIGVGVNVNIRDMYLPSCMKFEKNKNNEGKIDLNNKREMSQLVNRTGRGKTPISGIYTPREFVPYMQDIVMSGATDFNKVPAISIRPTDNLKEILLNLSNAAQSKYDKYSNLVRTTRSKVIDKLNNFREIAKEKIQERSDIYKQNQISIQLGNPKVQAEIDAAIKRQRADLERLAKYNNLNDRINDLDIKLTQVEKNIHDTETKIHDLEKNLAGIGGTQKPTAAVRSTMLRDLVGYRNLLDQYHLSQMTMVVDEYQALLAAIDEIHNTSADTDKRGIKSSINNKDFLTRKIAEIRGRYNPNLLKSRNETIMEFNKQLKEYNKHLEDIEKKYAAIQKSQYVPDNIKKALSTDIYNSKKFISLIIDKINKIQYYDNIQAKNVPGSLKF